MKANFVWEKEEYKAIELLGFYYKLFEEKEGGGSKRAYVVIHI